MYRTILRQFRRSSASRPAPIVPIQSLAQNPNYNIPSRSYAFTTAEEAAAERRRRKRRLRIEPPMFALRGNPPPQGRDFKPPNGPRLPDSTSALVGPRLSIHNRVQSLIRAGDLDSASAVARQAVYSRIRPTVFTCNAIIAAMYRAGRYTDAKALFHYFFNQFEIIPNIVSYNNLILAHFGNGDVEEAIKTYHHILEAAPFSPSCFTYRNLTKGLIEVSRIDEAVEMLREMLNKGQGADSLVYNNLISGFLELGNLEKANELFEELQGRCTVFDGVVSATFMDWYFKQGKRKEAMEAYRYLMSKQFRMVPATCNVILEVLVRYGMEKEAWSLFSDMLDNHTPPTFQAVNSDTFSIVVNECFRLGKISEAIEVFKRVGKGAKSRPFAMDVAGFNNMIARLCEVDMFEEAESFLVQLQSKSLSPDVTTYRTFIDAYVKSEKVEEALEKYRKMVVAGLRVIPTYANKWFDFLIEKVKVAECVPILMKMCEREPKPDVTTFEVVIRGLCEIGELDGCCYVVARMMNFDVGITPSLKEYIVHVFAKHGKPEIIERILDARFPSYVPPQVGTSGEPPAWLEQLKSPPPERLSLFPQRDELTPGEQLPWPRSVSPQLPREASVGTPQQPGSSQMPWQTSTGASQLPSRASFNAQVPGNGQEPWQSSVASPMPGHRSPEASQNPWQASSTTQFPRSTSQGPWQDSVSSQFPRSTSQGPWQDSVSSQFPGKSSEGTSQMPWQASSTVQHPGASQGQWHPWVSPQVPQHAPSSSHQSTGTSEMPWHTPSPTQMPEQAARAPPQMPGGVAWHQMAK